MSAEESSTKAKASLEHESQPACLNPFQFASVTIVSVQHCQGMDDLCAICRSDLIGQCLQCQTLPIAATTTCAQVHGMCPLVRGPCKHVFHSRCVTKWHTGRGIQVARCCPLCSDSSWPDAVPEFYASTS